MSQMMFFILKTVKSLEFCIKMSLKLMHNFYNLTLKLNFEMMFIPSKYVFQEVLQTFADEAACIVFTKKERKTLI